MFYLIQEFILGVFHVDKGFFFTIKELFIRPGKTLRNYLEGKRIRYFKPFGYLFLSATIYTFLSLALNISFNLESYVTDFMATTGEATHDVLDNINLRTSWITNNYALMNLLFLPFIALCSWLIFRKEKYNYGENVVIAAYISGQLNVCAILFFPILHWVNNPATTVYSQLWITIIIYIYMYASVFNNYSIGVRLIKTVALFLLILLLVTLAGFLFPIALSFITP